MRRIVATVLRRLGTLRHLIGTFLERGLPADAPRVETALLIGAAQILLLDVPDHAAVDLSVRLVQADRRAARYAGPGQRGAAAHRPSGRERLADVDTVALDTPDWLMARWTRTYGEDTARAIAVANAQEPALDLTVKNDAPKLGGAAARPRAADRHGAHHRRTARSRCCPASPKAPGGCRTPPPRCRRGCSATSRASASPICAPRPAARPRSSPMPARMSPPSTAPRRASPGCATICSGCGSHAETVVADAAEWQAGPFDAVLVDAPCSSTGTIRRHPDIPWLKQDADVTALARCSAGCSTARSR